MKIQPQIQLEHWLDQAQASLASGMISQAAMAVGKALADAPQSDQARLIQARIELARNEPESALSALDAHDLHHPEDREKPEIALLRAEALSRAGHMAFARELLEKLVINFPDDVRPRRMLAGVYQNLNELNKAQLHLKEVLRLTPSDDVSRRMLAELLSETSPQDGAELLATMLKPDDEFRKVSLRIARLFHQIGRDRDAEEIYSLLLDIEEPDEQLWLEAGQLADEMGASILAQQRLEKAGRMMGKMSDQVLAARAMSLMHAGRLAKAGRLWWQMFRQDKTNLEATAGLLVCGLSLGRHKIVRVAHRELAIHTSRDERRRAVMRLWAQAAGGMVVAKALKVPMRLPVLEQESLLSPLLTRTVQKLKLHADAHQDRADAQYHLAVCEMATGDARAAGLSVTRALDINPRYIAAAQLYAKLAANERTAA